MTRYPLDREERQQQGCLGATSATTNYHSIVGGENDDDVDFGNDESCFLLFTNALGSHGVHKQVTTFKQRNFHWWILLVSVVMALVACSIRMMSFWCNSPASNSNAWTQQHYGVSSAFGDDLYHQRLASYSKHPCLPQRVHIAQATNVDPTTHKVNMTVSFTLPKSHNDDAADVCGPDKAQVKIVYGKGSFPEGIVSQGERLSFDFDARERVENLSHYQSDWIFHYILPELESGRNSYWYQILVTPKDEEGAATLRASARVLGDTPKFSLTTPPVAHQPTSLALVGDLGQTENSTKTMHHIYLATLDDSNRPSQVPSVSQVLIAGDLSYADGDPYRWERWLELMEPLLRSTPLLSTPGNHEIECDNTTNEVFGMYEAYFRNPNRLEAPDRLPIDPDYRKSLWSCSTPSEFFGHYNYGNAFNSVRHGLAHIITLNSYTEMDPASPQYRWLQEELSNNMDRSQTPWLILMFHAPLHTTFLNHYGEVNPRIMLESMEPLFVQYGVNLVVSGHDHAYLRTKSMQGTDVDDTNQGPIYWTLGAGGNREGHTSGYVHETPEEWVAKRENDEYGYGHLYLKNATHAQLRWVRDGTTTKGIQDTTWLVNPHVTERCSVDCFKDK